MSETTKKMGESMLEEIEKQVGEVVKERYLQKKKIRYLFLKMRGKSPEMEDDRFWKLLDEFRAKCMSKFVTERYGNAGRFEHGATNFAWDFAYGKKNDIYELFSFVSTYEKKTRLISKALWDVVKDKGDDGYGDFCDSFLMHGREAYEAAVKGELLKPQEELDLGENYVRMRLEEATQKYWELVCQDSVGSDE